MKCLPRSETMSVGVPCFAKTCDKNTRARCSASISQKVGMNRAISVRWHTTTKIVSCLSDKGNPSIKSIEIESMVICQLAGIDEGQKAWDGGTCCDCKQDTSGCSQ